MLSTASDVDGDTLSVVSTPNVTAQDRDGNAVSVPDGGVSFNGAIMSVDPNAFDPLNTGQSLTFTAVYDITDGTATIQNTAVITINGYTDPFVTIAQPSTLNLAENNAGDVTPVSVGQVSATGHTTVSYSFSNGTQADGDFRIDSSTGVITYIGTGENYESDTSESNIAPSATLSTTVPNWFNNTEAGSLAAMVDGSTSTAGANNYAVHPKNADNQTITFDFDDNYRDPTFVFYSRTGAGAASRIDGTTVDYRLDGQTVHTETLDSANHVNWVITLDSPDNFRFDQVVMTFSGDDQNFREVEILAKQASDYALEVRATSGAVSDVVTVDVSVTDVNEAPIYTGPTSDQYALKGQSFSFTPDANDLTDPEGDTISFTATLQNGDPLPAFLTLDANTGEISTNNAPATGMFDIRLMAGDGNSSSNIDYTIIVTTSALAQAKIDTTVANWASGDETSNLAAMIDGNTSTTGDLDTAVQPSSADGTAIYFDLNAVYKGGIFGFYNSTNSGVDNIDDSIVRFSRNGSVVHTATLKSSNAENGRIVITPDADLEFDEISLTFNGDDQGFREIEIYGMPLIEWTSPQSFNLDENQNGAAVGALAATADAAVSFSFQNGSQTDGDFTINATTGAIGYGGAGFDYEGNARSNIAATATITTTVDQFYDNVAVSTALARITDGDTSSAGALEYAVHPENADGDTITFTFARAYMGPEFKFYNRPTTGQDRIDGSTVSFRREGNVVAVETLDHLTEVNDIITLSLGVDIVFDEVVLTFAGASQNFREIEIFAQQIVTQTLNVRATSGSYVSDNTVEIIVDNIDEAPTENGILQEQLINEGEVATYTLPDDIFVDPERGDLNYSAELSGGTPLPNWIQFDSDSLEFVFAPENGDDGKTDIYVYASDGAHTVSTDFTVEVNDIL